MNDKKIEALAIKCLEEDNRYRNNPLSWDDSSDAVKNIYLDSAKEILGYRRTKLIYRISFLVVVIVFVGFLIVGK